MQRHTTPSTIHGEVNFIYLAEFVILLTLFFFSKKFTLVTTLKMVERIIASLRIRIIARIKDANLYLFDKLGTASIYARLTQDTATLSQTAPMLVNAAQNAISVAFILVYLAIISFAAFIAIVGALTIAIALYLFYSKSLRRNMEEATVIEARFFSLLDGMLKGMKELKLNRKKSLEVFETIEENVSTGKEIKIGYGSQFAKSAMFSETTLYIIFGVLIFLMPIFSEEHAQDITKITTAVFFIVSPLNRVVSSLPIFAQANVAISNILRLEEELKDVRPPSEHTDFDKFKNFQKIELRDVYFEHFDPSGETTFESGPHNFILNRGEKLFLTGGNGAGKSTFLKLLTSLYAPKTGSIFVDDRPVRGNDLFPFRELFFAIFTDFHLFDRIYGVEEDESEVNRILLELGLPPEKVAYEEGKYTNLNLSTGQRKRLAIATCLMEDKPIFVFDEVAADQDPEFKQLFYTILMPEWIGKKGKTIILATHDDGYFQYGEQVVMKNGKIIDAEN